MKIWMIAAIGVLAVGCTSTEGKDTTTQLVDEPVTVSAPALPEPPEAAPAATDVVALSASDAEASQAGPAPEIDAEPVNAPAQIVFEADWDSKADGADWTALTKAAISNVGTALLTAEPSDVEAFCPDYIDLDEDGRMAFWVGLLSAMTRLESNFDPAVSFNEYDHCTYPGCKEDFMTQDGRKVVSRGLLQLSQESANGYRGCSIPADNEEKLHRPDANLTCGVVILTRWVEKDGQIAKTESPWRGGARYWSVLRRPNKIETIQAFTSGMEICGG